MNPPLECIEMNSTIYDVSKLKKVIKFKKNFLISGWSHSRNFLDCLDGSALSRE